MAWLVWIGTVMAIAGIAGILYSMIAVNSARRAGLSDDDLRARLSKLLPINIGALLFAILGLMMVLMGVLLP